MQQSVYRLPIDSKLTQKQGPDEGFQPKDDQRNFRSGK
jgi:hypothetical protein